MSKHTNLRCLQQSLAKRSPLRGAGRLTASTILLLGSTGSLFAQEPPVESSAPIPIAATEQPASSQEQVSAKAVASSQETAERQESSVAPERLAFAFDRAPWRDVIRWLADNCDMALQYEDLPTGSFTYSDVREFSQAEAIDRVNLFLLPQGYTLVRSGTILSVINLGDPRSQLQLDMLATMVPLTELDTLPAQTVVKCLFPLKELEPEDAVQELSVLNLMKPPGILGKTNQLMITDTVAKLRAARGILATFEPKTLANGTAMKSFALQHVSAEDILVVARPHLGLATDEMIGIDVSLSADIQGKHLFVTGVEDKITLIENLVQSLDKPAETLTSSDSNAELKSHRVRGGNLDTVYEVLQTLLAGKSLRLSIDSDADAIVALAEPEVQQEIALTIAQMEAEEAEFEVVELSGIEPVFAISLIEEMLDLSSLGDDGDSGPKIDADPGNRRLFVRGKRHEIEQIKSIIAGLERSDQPTEGEKVRILPLHGSSAVQTLETAARFWPHENAILLIGTAASKERTNTERVVAPDEQRKPAKLIAASAARQRERYLTDEFNAAADAIRCQFTPAGLLIQSDDSSLLDTFESHLRTVAGPTESLPSPPIVFYLKFTKAAESLTMLAELLDGGESAKEGQAGTLVNGFVSSGSFLGSLVTARDGTMTMTSGSMTIVADPRLNRLIAQGQAAEIDTIEQYLTIIDKSNSLTEVEVYGRSHVLELRHTKATEIAEVIKNAYSHRMAGTAGSAASGAAPQQRAGETTKRTEKGNTKPAPKKPTGSAAAQVLEPKMTVAVHELSNSLIITAPEQLFADVEALVKLIDVRSEQTMEVVGGAGALQAILGTGGSSRSGSGRSDSRGRSRSLPDLLRGKLGR